MSLTTLSANSEFQKRHIGVNPSEEAEMLATLGLKNFAELIEKVIPGDILSEHHFNELGQGQSEYQTLLQIKSVLGQNKIFKSFLGQGFYNTITPTVIQRNILENPVWYTAYTPYQAEISQGRLESLLNFQTMVADLTGMQIANSSLLDEGSAAAEAMTMAHALCKKADFNKVVLANDLHPHTIEVLQTRAEPLDFQLLIQDPQNVVENAFAVILQYPNTYGSILDHRALVEKYHAQGSLVIVVTDLLALTLLTPPGEWGADIVVGNSQRFGVPMGFGGPHAAFLATKETHKRLMPGRLVGVSVDSQGQRALRLALQTREQHIRREKATSNICTAQVLLANMAAMYAVYHGPQGLKNIALKIHSLTSALATELKKLNVKIESENYFDTLTVHTSQAEKVYQLGLKNEMNFRLLSPTTLGISLDETTQLETVVQILNCFASGLSVGSVDLSAITESFAKIQATSPSWPTTLTRQSEYLTHPVFSQHQTETELLRYIHHLQNKDITLTHSMIPLGSCTMKLNATTELVPVSWPEVNQIHPYAPKEQITGYIQLIEDLENKLSVITGFAGISLQPNAGSQGEYAGLLVIRKYFQSTGQAHRNICLIPSSAHGTNPASAVLVGLNVVVVQCDANGNIDVEDLHKKAVENKNNLAALMVTYPSTHGVFEERIVEICKIIHDHGGQVYMDGANMNALVGLCRPGEFGPDVCHLNLHKTFAIPHGGGGPGVGPIGVAEHLKPYLPSTPVQSNKGIGAVTSTYWGSASILPISWSYIQMMGAEGLRKSSLISILSANYIAKKLEKE
ncbi:MAG: aminomethyl-transferring glycine dehydrogenase, partial [Pseudobdellovibrionaceae bacterium]